MQSSVCFVMILCLCVNLCSHRPRIVRRLFLVIVFVFIFYIYHLCLPWHLVHLLVPFVMLDSFTLLCRHVFNGIQLFI